MSSDAIQDDVPLLDGVASIKPAHKHVASIAAPAGRLLRRLSKLRNVADETFYIANRTLRMVMMGVLGEYLWRALDESRRRPRYLIEAVTPGQPLPNRTP